MSRNRIRSSHEHMEVWKDEQPEGSSTTETGGLGVGLKQRKEAGSSLGFTQ